MLSIGGEEMTTSPSRLYSGHHKAAKEDSHPETTEKRSGARNVDSGLQVQLDKDEGAAKDRAGQSRVVCGYCSTESDKA